MRDEIGLIGKFSWGGIFARSGLFALVRCAILTSAGGLGFTLGTLGSMYGATNLRFGEHNGCLGFFSIKGTLGAGAAID